MGMHFPPFRPLYCVLARVHIFREKEAVLVPPRDKLGFINNYCYNDGHRVLL